ncbi:hypothetical protein [Mycobacterium sp. E1747]|uniref:hypothetical protein n=1 Tax=Mycobacterium sp. E1747 TaxID=1834128 RepID=UPI0007FF1E0F|nr:hypothetical protein [Mycobacterium sp. E1747]OBH08946.1 hypothetical protein A5695_25255 [Mycobacterium sp. E1747]
MSAETLHAIETTIRAHIAETHGDVPALTDWFVSYGAMTQCDDSPTGLSYITNYCTSDGSPQGALGIASLGLRHLADDLSGAE